MSDLHRDRPVTLADDLAPRLRDALAGWTVDAVADALGDRAIRAMSREQTVPALVAARALGDAPVALLTRLFILGDELTRDQADRALGEFGVAQAIASGLLAAAGQGGDDAVRALVDLRPTAVAGSDGEATVDWWVASDQGEAVTGRRLAGDHVLGVGGASATLAGATMRTPVDRVLDLGTGCGIQALHASTHARAIVATDISRRALNFAAFNHALNAPAAHWDLREGSMLEPVVGELFDLVVSNPPFVITPPGTPSFEYRDGGHGGDGLVASLMRHVGSVLAPGGVAQHLGNWEIGRGAAWDERLESWLDASQVPLDAWIIQRDLLDAAEYAETWLRDAGVTPERDRAGFRAAYEAYLADFDARRVEAIGFGVVTLRRPASGRPTLRRLEEHEGAVAGPLGAHLASALAAHDWQVGRADDALLEERYVVAPDVTKETYGRATEHEPEHILIRQGGGLGRSVRADTALAGFVSTCDGELTAGQIAGALAALLDVPMGAMAAGIATALRDLVVDGFLAPASALQPARV
ncbi:methyltransferase [Demequina capsici]|uniref:Methyltransferase n=1 Tax=Demequina capsici TaxID=3075620 RepID=A0AA96FAU0_9MICO|nr:MULTISPECIES: methyltransferase [unclassified Demequina]WNM24845.1 methyltransferase [Demequina sp. OYTSA14]WNM27752.1 methyltransferase [Demequina sp. PMTSA13]